MKCYMKGCRKKAKYHIKESLPIRMYRKIMGMYPKAEFDTCDDHLAIKTYFVKPKVKLIKKGK